MKRRDFLLASMATALSPLAPGFAIGAEDRMPRRFENLFIVMLPGGWDTTYLFEPKPDNANIHMPVGDIAQVGALELWLDNTRPATREFFEKYHSLCAVVNGLQVRSIAHLPCTRRILTGRASDDAADFGSIIGHELGRDLPVGKLALGNVHFAGPLAHSTVTVGATNQLIGLLKKSEAYGESATVPFPAYSANTAERAAIRTYLQTRVERERAQRGRLGANRRLIENYVTSLDQSQILRDYADEFGDRGVTLDIAAQGEIALAAVRSGLTRVVLLQDRANWDTHTSLLAQSSLMETLFTGLTSLLGALEKNQGSRSGNTLLDESLVVVLSEMSRTPLPNFTGGKDHWPYTSALVIGPEIKTGVYGGTDDTLSGWNVDLATGAQATNGVPFMAENLLAGIIHGAGVDSKTWLEGVEGFNAIWR